ncbi:DMT family transporter [Sinanaerobacter chloroacetimidivorans]|jgi:small multidrug resistance pump|uniref:Multidrug efflux SMR transporter n=1 Tax=Sinanaerobacter chloroacetimidivorans TaxID=2818044 RepID=A0A8J8AZY5_9FIRM|nr:multidrug efflux SMR transporter [Sinanaerobacter chloroacetimidivorans]MBR0597023.1 multidrug efflux SMR transporter [Sinanaerobacter chloroacetimidivorans]
MAYIYLGLAIGAELFATTLLKYSDGFSKLLPSVSSLTLYGLCFFFLSKALQNISLSVAYATWCGLGIAVTTLISVYLFKEHLSAIGVIGILLVIAGVTILNFYGPSG